MIDTAKHKASLIEPAEFLREEYLSYAYRAELNGAALSAANYRKHADDLDAAIRWLIGLSDD